MSAMEQAIHATQHSALALDLTANALSDAADNQKSELILLLSDLVKDSEKDLNDQQVDQSTTVSDQQSDEDSDSVEKISKVRSDLRYSRKIV